MNEKKFDLEDRLVRFAAEVIKLVKKLQKDRIGEYFGMQILRSSASAALNFGEAQGTYSQKDYLYKAALSLKELKESRVNLKIMEASGYGNPVDIDELFDEVEQLIKIVATIIKNKKSH